MSEETGDAIASYSIERIRETRKVPIDVVKDKEALSDFFSETTIEHIRKINRKKGFLVIIMPVGPTGQWGKILKTSIREKVSLSRLAIIQMDEYLTGDGSERVTMNDPFSFTGFVWNNFASEAIAKCGFKKENWIIPDPKDPGAVERAIRNWGGVDIAFAGIGLNGHLAFNEPPTSSSAYTDESFFKSSTRIIRVEDTTKATNSIFGTGGDLGIVPDFAVTVGMKQILDAKSVHVFLDWPWQKNVFRRTLLGPITRSFPASSLQMHSNVRFTITEEVALIHSILPE